MMAATIQKEPAQAQSMPRKLSGLSMPPSREVKPAPDRFRNDEDADPNVSDPLGLAQVHI